MKWRARSAGRGAALRPERRGAGAGFYLGLVLWLVATLLAIVSGKPYAAPLAALAGWLVLCALLAGRHTFREH